MALVATITLEVVPSGMYAPFSALLPFLISNMEVMFCAGARNQRQQRFCLDYLICVKMVAF
jgi:hypothetical protein